MCRSMNRLSILVSMQFFANYRITLTAHIAIITDNPGLTQLSGDVSLASFCPEGFVGIGVQIGTDTFARNFVVKTCRSIIDDVQKLDVIQDGFTHYQILRFYQDTRLQYINSHILLGNRCVLQ
jgi:hypothetical protein